CGRSGRWRRIRQERGRSVKWWQRGQLDELVGVSFPGTYLDDVADRGGAGGGGGGNGMDPAQAGAAAPDAAGGADLEALHARAAEAEGALARARALEQQLAEEIAQR